MQSHFRISLILYNLFFRFWWPLVLPALALMWHESCLPSSSYLSQSLFNLHQYFFLLLFQILMGVAHVCLHCPICDNLNLLRLPRHLDHHLQTQQVRSGIFIVIVASFRNLAFYLLFFLEKRQLLEYSELLISETFRINRGSLNS